MFPMVMMVQFQLIFDLQRNSCGIIEDVVHQAILVYTVSLSGKET